MIRYVGGKTNLSKELVEVMTSFKRTNHQYYLEACVGGGSIISKTHILGLTRIACDLNKDLIDLYKAIQQGWIPPKTITELEYIELKRSESSPLRTWCGFEASFGGKWFGGYARGNNRNFSNEGYRRIIKVIHTINDVHFHHKSLFDIQVNEKALIYVDPPYQATMGYNGSSFDHASFWDQMRKWSQTGAKVLISEYEAPNDFQCIWSKDHFASRHLSLDNKRTVEKLFMYKGESS